MQLLKTTLASVAAIHTCLQRTEISNVLDSNEQQHDRSICALLLNRCRRATDSRQTLR